MLHRDFTKITPAEVNWPVLYDVISACGKSHNPRSFCIDILENIGRVCPFDQALLYMIDANHKLFGHYLKNVDENCANLDYIIGEGRTIDCDYIMTNNFAFGGINTSLILKKP